MTRQFWIVVGSMAGGLLVVGWLGWQFLLSPQVQKKAALEGALAAKKTELEQVKGAKAQYEKFKRDAEATRHEVQLLRQRLAPELAESELVRIIAGQVQRFNPNDLKWEYSQRTASKLAGQSGLDEVAFKMTFKSDYETVGRFLNGMVAQTRMISPEKLKLNTLADLKESRLTLSADIEFKMFMETRSK